MTQTPQPEESPDEILARRIEDRKSDLLYSYECFRPEEESAAIAKDLAMLEAMRALRAAVSEYLTEIEYDESGDARWICCYKKQGQDHVPSCVAATALRQSDDAIRGMRG